jgi:transcription elongation factor GreA
MIKKIYNLTQEGVTELKDELLHLIAQRPHVADPIIQNSQIIKKPKSDGQVRLGSSVKLKDGGKPLNYQVVGTMEANPAAGKISDESPIGKALLGRKVGDKVEIKTPAGAHMFKVIEIS